ncbi:binding protein [Actinidia rufa]|uniref:Binding protein n=1 Tax=Actinidia rufa TaxID=165716 RepID=A0A7J0DC30_9ERIC|nr:binding protein [Actinidia rufa]
MLVGCRFPFQHGACDICSMKHRYFKTMRTRTGYIPGTCTCIVLLNTYRVVSTGPNPEWDESFAWLFESPPKGQKLHISCKNKSKMGKSSFGKVTIQIDRVVTLGTVAGEYTLLPESKSGPSRNLEIEFQWCNK